MAKKTGEEAVPAVEVAVQEILLGDGSRLTIRPLKGKDLLQAQVICNNNPSALTLAMTAVASTRDGKKVLYEDLLEEDAFIVIEMMNHVMGGKAENFLSATPGVSSITGTSPAQA